MIPLLLLAAAPETRNISIQLPPVAPPAGASRAEAVLVDFVPDAADCDGATARAISTVAPLTIGAFRRADAAPAIFELRFRIARDGRPIGIGAPTMTGGSMYLPADDLAPALSLWRFAPAGRERSCTIRFTARLQPIATTPMDAIYRFAALSRQQDAGVREAVARIRKVDCIGERAPTPLLRGFPDYAKLPESPGVPAYSVVAFDIDAAGVPANIGMATGSGQARLDEAAREAVARSRFAEGDARERCTMPFVQWPRPPIEAPESPDPDPLRPRGATCPKLSWATPPAINYPGAFRRRGIEGWAILRFDLAPGGQPGNVAVLASEPAEIFGAHARRMLPAARAADTPTGLTGCVERIRFRMAR